MVMTNLITQPCHDSLWYAKLELGFRVQADRTVLSHRKHYGPVRVQKMLWPERTGICHAIIVHPPAGIAGGDHLTFDIHVGASAHALVTTPGAGKWYRTNAKQAFQHIFIHVENDAVFNGCHKKPCCLMVRMRAQKPLFNLIHGRVSLVGICW